MTNFYAIGQFFVIVNKQILKKLTSHLVTLIVIIFIRGGGGGGHKTSDWRFYRISADSISRDITFFKFYGPQRRADKLFTCLTSSVTKLGDLLDFRNLFNSSLWPQLFCPNLLHSYAILVKVSKSLIFLVKSF